MIHRSDLERLTTPLESFLKDLMEEVSQPAPLAGSARQAGAAGHTGGTEMQVNYQGAVPQRIDCRGTKIEDLAGTGRTDSLGG